MAVKNIVGAALLCVVILVLGFTTGARVIGHRWPRLRMTHYEKFHIDAPGMNANGMIVCPSGCDLMEEVGRPAMVNSRRLDATAGRGSYCSTLELVDYKDKYSEGSEVLYDSCS